MSDLDQDRRDLVERRRQAYARVFGDRSDPDVRLILEDLALFTRFFDAPAHPEPAARDVLIGRREVFSRIMDHVIGSTDDLFDLYQLRRFGDGR